MMKALLFTASFLWLMLAGHAQTSQRSTDKKVGGACERCNLIYEGMPASLQWETTLTPPGEPGEPMILSGTIYKRDGKTPASGIVLYVYHTDDNGRYSPSAEQTNGLRHGHLRGWIKTDDRGRYQFITIRPKAYPNAKIPAHVHPIIKEPGLTEYYIDEYLFDGDPFLTTQERTRQEHRGGDGIIKLIRNQKGEWAGHRDIILGMNIPGY